MSAPKTLIGYVVVHFPLFSMDPPALAWTTDNGPKDTIYPTRDEAQKDACPNCEVAEVWV